MWTLKEYSCKQPRHGTWFHLEDGFLFEGDTPQATADKVGQYRLGHGKPFLDPLQSVLETTGRQYPHLVKANEDCNEKSAQNVTLGDELQAWALAQATSLKDLEIDLIANTRESVCLKCPHHVSFGFKTDDEVSRYEQVIAKVTKGKSMKRKRLNACSEYKMDCRVMVYSKTETLPANDLVYCWVGRDLSEFI